MTLQFTYCDVLADVADIYNLLPVQKQKAKIAQYHKCVENSVFLLSLKYKFWYINQKLNVRMDLDVTRTTSVTEWQQ